MLQGERRYRGQFAYNQSKLANVLFTYELARRLEGTGVTANCVHPGVVRTNFGRDDAGAVQRLMTPLATLFMRTPEQGAETSVWLASSPEVEGVTGRYFADKTARRSSKRSYDTGLARRLCRSASSSPPRRPDRLRTLLHDRNDPGDRRDRRRRREVAASSWPSAPGSGHPVHTPEKKGPCGDWAWETRPLDDERLVTLGHR